MTKMAHRAVIIGAGIGGLAAAAALQPRFEHVVLIERDALPEGAQQRPSVPQGRHLHGLLAGGQRALCGLLPGLETALVARGAVRMNVALEMVVELPGFDPFPQRDFGFHAYSVSRVVLEAAVRQQVLALPQVELRDRCSVQAIVVDAAAERVTAVRYKRGNDTPEELSADVVIDASGRGELTLELLRRIAYAEPHTSVIGVDLGYGTACFELPEAPAWTTITTLPLAPLSSRGAALTRVEDGRFVLSAGGRMGDFPTADPAQFMEYLHGLRTQTIHDIARHAELREPIALFRFPESRRRHFEHVPSMPRGLLPLGDALCRFNPIHGQGMSVAALQAVALGKLLDEYASWTEAAPELGPRYFEQAARIIDGPWLASAVPDFVFRQTTGERPANWKDGMRFMRALTELAAIDADVHRVMIEVQHLLEPRTAFEAEGVADKVRVRLNA